MHNSSKYTFMNFDKCIHLYNPILFIIISETSGVSLLNALVPPSEATFFSFYHKIVLLILEFHIVSIILNVYFCVSLLFWFARATIKITID